MAMMEQNNDVCASCLIEWHNKARTKRQIHKAIMTCTHCGVEFCDTHATHHGQLKDVQAHDEGEGD
jgi:hypothetical protein